MVRSIFCVGFHNDETNGKISAAEEVGGRDRDRTGDPLLAKQISSFLEICGIPLIPSDWI
jgi:hypothetical protein